MSSSLYIRSLARYWSNFFGFFAMYAPTPTQAGGYATLAPASLTFGVGRHGAAAEGMFPFPGETSNYRPSHSLRGEHASAAMTRYFFHIKYKAKMILDEEGMDLRDLDAVREEAEESARQITSDRLLFGELIEDETFVVMDDHGQTVLTFAFKDAVHD